MKTSKHSKAREKAGGRVVIGFSFASDWLRKWRQFFFDQSQGEVKQNQSNPWLLSTLNWKLLSPWIIFRGGDVNETTEFLLFQINDKILLRYSWCEQKSNQLSRIAIESE